MQGAEKKPILTLWGIIKSKKKVEFRELFDNLSRDYIIVTFLALLEMFKAEEINIVQEGNFNSIYITGGSSESSN